MLTDEEIAEIRQRAESDWNLQADRFNQWWTLGSDERDALFARAIEQAATRKAIKRPEPGTTEYGSWINTAQKEACRCYFENEQSSRFKWLCAFEQALHRALLPDSKEQS